MIKTEEEISVIRNACHITDQCFTEILLSLKPGVTEKEISDTIETYIKKRNADLSFPSIVAFGKNTSIVHHLKASPLVRCRKQEIVLLDFGAKVDGYCSDMTRMVFVGEPRITWVRTYETLVHIQETIIKMITPVPFSGATIDIYARSLIEKAGFPPYPHGLGHNVGMEIHELPRLSRKKDAQITPGMVFTIEPGIYIKGDYGIRIEDTVLLKKDGLEILTKSPKTMICL
jgi:Xaa-Pro aminopeptidase